MGNFLIVDTPKPRHKLEAGARSSAAEQPAHNRRVVGSTPSGPTNVRVNSPQLKAQ